MGRKACDTSEYFGEPFSAGKSRSVRICKYCKEDHAYRDVEPPTVANRRQQLQHHLAHCVNAPNYVRDMFLNAKRPAARENEDDAIPEKKQKVAVWTTTMFMVLLLQFQHDNLLPDTFIEKESTLALFRLLCPGIILPPRRRIGETELRSYGRKILETQQSELRGLQAKSGGWVNLLSDVWKNISKVHLLCSQLTFFSKVIVFGLIGQTTSMMGSVQHINSKD